MHVPTHRTLTCIYCHTHMCIVIACLHTYMDAYGLKHDKPISVYIEATAPGMTKYPHDHQQGNTLMTISKSIPS